MELDIVRAWKDPLYRMSLPEDVAARMPPHPAGTVAIGDPVSELSAPTIYADDDTCETPFCTAPTYSGQSDCDTVQQRCPPPPPTSQGPPFCTLIVGC
jgi:mersacidin/lichenicidin family type 2 lantibiotic